MRLCDMSPKDWWIAPEGPPGHLEQFSPLHPLVVQVLYNRGVADPRAMTAFLEPDDEVNPFALEGMSEAVTRIRWAMRSSERIAVYGDFDADGVTATALLVQTLRALGAEACPYIPDRQDEGYGLKKEALTGLARDGFSLVITVDCGIRALEQVDHANALGVDVIVTDHHCLGPRLPKAVAVINPRRDVHPVECPSGFREGLSGCGVAYRLAQALLRAERQTPVGREQVSLDEEHLVDLVALGTVADLVPLRGENRALVRRGLERINAMERVGIGALCARAGLKPGDVDAASIGYVLGPRLNAAGRLCDAEMAYRLLLTEDPVEAVELADELDSLNRQRQELTRVVHEKARELVSRASGESYLLFAADSGFPAGIAGLVAGRLTDEFYRPAVVVEVGDKVARGSGRSIPEFDIADALEECEPLLVKHGGHPAAAGFTVTNDQLRRLAERLCRIAAEQLSERELLPRLNVDAETDLSKMSWDLLEALAQLEPYGCGNERPLFVSRSARVCGHRAVGREGRHLKLAVSDGAAAWDAIAFRQGKWAGRLPETIDLAYHLEVNVWNGQRRLQLNVQDIRPAASSVERCAKSKVAAG